jgi:hypothetical protein
MPLRDAPGILAGNSWIVEELLVVGLVSHRRGSGKPATAPRFRKFLCAALSLRHERVFARAGKFSSSAPASLCFTGVKLRASGMPNSSAATPLFAQIVDGHPHRRGPSGESVSIPEQHFDGSRSQATIKTVWFSGHRLSVHGRERCMLNRNALTAPRILPIAHRNTGAALLDDLFLWKCLAG